MVDPNCGAFDAQNIRLILGSDATRSYIIRSFEKLSKIIDNEDSLWVYYAGHAVKLGENDTYWIPHNAYKSTLRSDGISQKELSTWINRYIECKQKLLLFDCCHAEGMLDFISTRNVTTPDEYLSLFTGEGCMGIASATSVQTAIELNQVKQGAFTYYIAKGLSGDAVDSSKEVICYDDLWRYLNKKIENIARKLGDGHKQTPVSVGRKTHDFALTLNPQRSLNNRVNQVYQNNSASSVSYRTEMVSRVENQLYRLTDDNGYELPMSCLSKCVYLIKGTSAPRTNNERELLKYLNNFVMGDLPVSDMRGAYIVQLLGMEDCNNTANNRANNNEVNKYSSAQPKHNTSVKTEIQSGKYNSNNTKGNKSKLILYAIISVAVVLLLIKLIPNLTTDLPSIEISDKEGTEESIQVSDAEDNISSTADQVEFKDIDIIVNQNKYGMYYNNGEIILPVMIDGKLYMPAVAISEIFKKTAIYDTESSTVYIGEEGQNKPDTYLDELQYTYYESGSEHNKMYVLNGSATDFIGNEYNNGLLFTQRVYQPQEIIFPLNMNFTTLKGQISMIENAETAGYDGYARLSNELFFVEFYADNELIYTSPKSNLSNVLDFNIDITNVGELTIKILPEIIGNLKSGTTQMLLSNLSLFNAITSQNEDYMSISIDKPDNPDVKSIDLQTVFDGMNYIIKSSNGEKIEAYTIDGVIYLPLIETAMIYDENAEFDRETSTIDICTSSQYCQNMLLDDIQYTYYESGSDENKLYLIDGIAYDFTGDEYTSGFLFTQRVYQPQKLVFPLNAEYSTLSGVIAMIEDAETSGYSGGKNLSNELFTIEIYADDEKIYTSPKTNLSNAIEFNTDVQNTENLRIEIIPEEIGNLKSSTSQVILSNLILN